MVSFPDESTHGYKCYGSEIRWIWYDQTGTGVTSAPWFFLTCAPYKMESLTHPDFFSLAHPDHKNWIPFHEKTVSGLVLGDMGGHGTWGHGPTGLGIEWAGNWFFLTCAPWPKIGWNNPLGFKIRGTDIVCTSHLGLIGGGGNFQVATSYLLAKWTLHCREELCYELAI